MQKYNKYQTTVVEFFGLPGAGKTTIQDEVFKRLKNKDIHVCKSEQFINWCKTTPKVGKLSLIVLNIKYVFSILKLILKTADYKDLKDKEYYNFVFKVLTIPVYLKNFIAHNDFNIILLDQGSLQIIWSIWARRDKPDNDKLNNILRHINKIVSTDYIYFELDIKESARRVINRSNGNSRFEKYGYSKLLNQWKEDEKFIIRIYRHINKINNKVIKIDASRGIEVSACEIINHINN